MTRTKSQKTNIQNRKARHEYFILEEIEAGIVLTGSEIKSLREGKANIQPAFAEERGGEIWLLNSHISEYKGANKFNHKPLRPRKLLLHKKEIKKLIGKVKEKGVTLIPLSLYINQRNIAKVKLALGKGKKLHDKRADIKEREWKRDKERIEKEKFH
ncbi:SsrA-binding protein SmpB [Pseudomonadota bacterium]